MTRRSHVLMTDAVVNVVLGALLLLFPQPVVDFLGIPSSETRFYPSMLGAVLVGIGVALLLEARPARRLTTAGLGLSGAVAINVCAGIAPAGWLLLGWLRLPVRGAVVLWLLVLVVLGVSAAESATEVRTRSGAQRSGRSLGAAPA